MIVLDTNVLSEMMRSSPAESVNSWMEEQARESLFTTTVTQAEILYGIALMPESRKKRALAEAVDDMFSSDFRGRVLSFDGAAAHAFADLSARRRKMGHPISHFDAQIAAIALSRGAAIASRNAADFEDCGIDVVNPWQAST